MLAYIKGKIKYKKQNYFVIDNSGLGYKVFVNNELLLKFNESEKVELYLYQHVKEDLLQLFGFESFEELELFELLISISGVGPKTALNVFMVADINDIKSAIVNEDASILKKVSGIGAKTAERIVLELKNKVSGNSINLKTKQEMNQDIEAIEALVSLGFSNSQAKDALNKVDKNTHDLGETIKKALQILNQ